MCRDEAADIGVLLYAISTTLTQNQTRSLWSRYREIQWSEVCIVRLAHYLSTNSVSSVVLPCCIIWLLHAPLIHLRFSPSYDSLSSLISILLICVNFKGIAVRTWR